MGDYKEKNNIFCDILGVLKDILREVREIRKDVKDLKEAFTDIDCDKKEPCRDDKYEKKCGCNR